jgi:hypothetical protein
MILKSIKYIPFYSILMASLLITGCDPNPAADNGDRDNGDAIALTFGGSGEDVGNRIIQTTDGGFLIVGSTSSDDGDFDGLAIGSDDIFALKLNSSRETEWIKTFGGSGSDRAYSAIEDVGGNFVITGSTNSNNGTFAGQNRGNSDIFLIKISPEGDLIWARIFGGSGEDHGYALIQAPNNNYIIAGSTRSTDFNFFQRSNNSRDAFLLATDINGQPNWVLPFGGTGNDDAFDLTISLANTIVATGTFESIDGSFFATEPGDAGIFVHETDLSGRTLALSTYGGGGIDIANSITLLNDGSYVIAGRSNSNTGLFDGQNHGSFDAFLLRLNFNLTVNQINTFGGSSFDEAHAVLQTSGGNLLVAGETDSDDHDFDGRHSGQTDLFLALFDTNLQPIWMDAYGGSDSEAALSVFQSQNGDFALTGWTRSSDGIFDEQPRTQPDLFFLLTDSDGVIK